MSEAAPAITERVGRLIRQPSAALGSRNAPGPRPGTTDPGRIDDRDGRTTMFTYDPVSGAPATVNDKRRNDQTITYSNGLPEEIYADLDLAMPLLRKNEYDPVSKRLERVIEPTGRTLSQVAL